MGPPEVRFTRSFDGTRVAYACLGEGTALLHLAMPELSHARLLWSLPGMSDMLATLARRHRVIRADLRGTGMADRDTGPISLADLCRDAIAILDAAGVSSAHVLVAGPYAALGLRLAAYYPERVRSLLLSNPNPIGPDGPLEPGEAKLWQYAAAFPELYSELAAQRMFAVPTVEMKPWVEFVDACVSFDRFYNIKALDPGIDDLTLARSVTCPALVYYRTSLPTEGSEAVARNLPNARMAELPHDAFAPRSTQPIAELVRGFLEEIDGVEDVRPAAPLSPRELEVADLVAHGRTNAQIAERLVIAEATVARHVHNILTKLALANRTELAAWAATRRAPGTAGTRSHT